MNDSVQVSPDELWSRFEFLRNQLTLEYMRERYTRMQQTSEARLFRQAFSIALEQWDDAQIKEFLCERFFSELPESEILARETPEARRRLFERLYRFIILGESSS
jgi:hypothetical protein